MRFHHRPVQQAPRCPWCGIYMKFVRRIFKNNKPFTRHVCPKCDRFLDIGR